VLDVKKQFHFYIFFSFPGTSTFGPNPTFKISRIFEREVYSELLEIKDIVVIVLRICWRSWWKPEGYQSGHMVFRLRFQRLECKLEALRSDFLGNKIHYLYFSQNVTRVKKSIRMRWATPVALMGERRGAYGFLAGKHEVKGPLGKPRRRWNYNIKMEL
jgi:hypothetical protein